MERLVRSMLDNNSEQIRLKSYSKRVLLYKIKAPHKLHLLKIKNQKPELPIRFKSIHTIDYISCFFYNSDLLIILDDKPVQQLYEISMTKKMADQITDLAR